MNAVLAARPGDACSQPEEFDERGNRYESDIRHRHSLLVIDVVQSQPSLETTRLRRHGNANELRYVGPTYSL